MNVTELYQLTEWIDENIRATNVAGQYQAIHNALQKNAQAGQQQQPIEPHKENLIKIIADISLEQLTVDQLAFLSRLGISEYVGPHAIEGIEDILYKNALDIPTAAAEFNKIFNEINAGLTKSEQIKGGLSDLIDPEELPEDEALIRVGFAKEASVNNVADWKKWSSIWYDIGRGIALAHNQAPEDVKVVGAKKGSIVIELAVAYAIAKTTGKIILFALQVAEKVITIKKQAAEIRHLELKNEQIATQLEQEAVDLVEEKKQSITILIFEELGINDDADGEKRSALEKAIKKLIDFIERGGDVDCVLPEEIEEEEDGVNAEDIKAIRDEFKEIRLLEEKINQLEHKEP